MRKVLLVRRVAVFPRENHGVWPATFLQDRLLQGKVASEAGARSEDSRPAMRHLRTSGPCRSRQIAGAAPSPKSSPTMAGSLYRLPRADSNRALKSAKLPLKGQQLTLPGAAAHSSKRRVVHRSGLYLRLLSSATPPTASRNMLAGSGDCGLRFQNCPMTVG